MFKNREQRDAYEHALGRFVDGGFEAPERCGEPMSIGGWCPQNAGNGTDHEGVGRCRTHGGSSKRGKMEASWLEAHRMARELDVTPWEALLLAVRQEAGALAFYQLKIGEVTDDQELKPGGDAWDWVDGAARSRERMAKYSKAAIDAGIAERFVRQTEIEGKLVAEALGRALDALQLSPEQRMVAVQAAQQALLGQPKVIEGTTA